MLSTGSNPTLVTDFLHSQQCPVKPRDVHNIKSKLKFSGTPVEEIDAILQKPGITYCVDKDDTDTLQCLTFCTDKQQQLATDYGNVILLDGTYRINKLRMPLYTLAVVDSESHGQPIAHALLAREDTAHISLFLEHVKQWNTNMDSAIFTVDKDFAKFRLYARLFPLQVYICAGFMS